MASRPSWKTTNESWEWGVSIWKRMAQGENDTQIGALLQRQGHPLSRDTVAKVRRELESLPDALAETLPETVQVYRGQLKGQSESTTNALNPVQEKDCLEQLNEHVPRLRICGETVTTYTNRRHFARYATLDVPAISNVEAPGSWAWAEIKSRGLSVPLHWAGDLYTPEESSAPRRIIRPHSPARLDVAFALPPPGCRGVIPGVAMSGQVSSVAVVLIESGYFERDDFFAPIWHGEGCWLAQPVALYNPDQRLAAYLPPGRYGLKVTVGCAGGEGDGRHYTLVSPESWEGLELNPC